MKTIAWKIGNILKLEIIKKDGDLHLKSDYQILLKMYVNLCQGEV